MGNKKVRVRGYLKEELRAAGEEKGGDKALTLAKEALERIVAEISPAAEVEGRVERGTIYLNIKGDGSGILIGRHGQTLDALQYIVTRIVGKRFKEKRSVIIDSQGYRQRRRESLEELSRRMGEKAKATGRPVTLPPMNARDRRIVHLTLKNDRELETRSEGEGRMKSVKIIPRKKGG